MILMIIDDFNEECSECVKNVKIKTFKYKDEKYKDNDQYGMVAQELLEHLPKAMKGIVKENKDKDTEETFLSINYMKTSLILWKALQESMTKISHLEASVYELQEAVKELKGKGKGKAKAKAKSKRKLKYIIIYNGEYLEQRKEDKHVYRTNQKYRYR